ncbi:hypothetical protein BH09SUM1_BH09SUM1_25940 [soil metagenome]
MAAAASSSEKKSPVSASLVVRGVVALAIVMIAFLANRQAWNGVRAELLAARGVSEITQEGGLFVGMDKMKAALKLAPGNPEFGMELGSALLKSENQKAAANDLGSLDWSNLQQAHDYFLSVRETHPFPATVYVKLAETSNMIATYLTIQKRDEERLRYSKETVENYEKYIDIAGRPYDEPTLLYYPAIRRAQEVGRPDLAVNLHDDFARYFGEDAFKDKQVVEVANYARMQIGEAPMAMASIMRELRQDPTNGRMIGQAIVAARERGQARNAALIFDMIERLNLLSEELRGYQQELKELMDKEQKGKV